MVLLSACWFWWSAQQTYLAEGNAYLDVGRYSDARQPYQQALKLNPFSTRASRGLDIVQLSDLRSDPVAFERKMKELSNGASRNAYLKVLQGDFLLAEEQRDEAFRHYQEAVRLNPRFAEGYFRLGVLYGLRRDSKRSLEMYQRAVDLAPGSAQYRNNLADAYFKRGEYANAIDQFAQIDRLPSAALEMANIHRLLGQLDQALEKEQIAVGWLEDDAVMAIPENRLPWDLELSQDHRVWVPSRDQKLCYARWELSATFYLMGKENRAQQNAAGADQACGAQSLDVKTVLLWELRRLADEQDALAPRIASYRRSFLQATPAMGVVPSPTR